MPRQTHKRAALPPRRDRGRRARPMLEPLEDRLAPAVFTVNSVLSGSSGSGLSGTLAYCIEQSNALAGADTIRFDGAVFGDGPGQAAGVTLDRALPTVTDHLTIQGPDGLRPRVERSGEEGAPKFRLFTIAAGASVTLARLEIAGGVAPSGGGVHNSGELVICECLVRDNTATEGAGGGVFSTGAVVILDSELRDNRELASGLVGEGLFVIDVGVGAKTGGEEAGQAAPTEGNEADLLRPAQETGLSAQARPDPVFEGQRLTLSGSFTDLGLGEQHDVAIFWGDGTADFVTLPPGVYQFTADHVYLGPLETDEGGKTTIFVQVSDGEGSSGTAFVPVTVLNAAPVVSAGGDAFLNVGQAFARAGSFTDSEQDRGEGATGEQGPGARFVTHTATVDYGDGSGEVPLQLTVDQRFLLSHIYRAEGSFEVVVRIQDGRGAVGRASFIVDVLLAGVPTAAVVKKSAGPGQTVTAATAGVSATLIRAAGGPAVASILVAVVPAAVAGALPGGAPGTVVAAFDVRTRTVGAGDRAIVTFRYSGDELTLPTLSFFDRAAGKQRVIPPALYVVDRAARTITLVLDSGTVPRLADLGGTVFTISVPVSVTPSFDPTPLAALTGLTQTEVTSPGPTARGGEGAVVAGITALSQFEPGGDGEGYGTSEADRGGQGERRREGPGLVSELPAPPTGLMGLLGATATASFPESLWEPWQSDEAEVPEKKAGPEEARPKGPAAPDEGQEDEGPPVRPDQEGRDEAFTRIGSEGARAAEPLLVIAACLLQRPRPRKAARREDESPGDPVS